MTEMLWYKRFHGTAYDPKFTAAAAEAGSTHCNALGVWDALLETTSENDADRGSLEGTDLRVVAAGLHLAADEVKRIWDAFVSLGMIVGKRVAKWAKRQGAAVAELAQRSVAAVSAGALRMRRYRQRKAKDERQGELAFAPRTMADPPPHAAQGVTSGVTPGVTVTAEREGRAQRIPPSSTVESLRASAVFDDDDEGDSVGRDAPFCETRPSEKVVKLSVGPALKAQKKELRRQKVIRFINATYAGEELRRRMNGMLGLDAVRDEQWWFDKCDAERKVANWDDIRDRERSMPVWMRLG